jgi:hypothetical protein
MEERRKKKYENWNSQDALIHHFQLKFKVSFWLAVLIKMYCFETIRKN